MREAPAMKRKVSMVLETSSSDTACGLPVLADSMTSNASRFSSMMFAMRFRTSARSFGVVAPQVFWATTAAATAASTSSAVPAWTEAMTRSVVGSTTSISRPVEPGTKDPLMKCPAGGKRQRKDTVDIWRTGGGASDGEGLDGELFSLGGSHGDSLSEEVWSGEGLVR